MTLFENAIFLINELIKIRNKENDNCISLGKTKESTTLKYKLKNYKKWIENINILISNKTIINNKYDIINLNFKDKLTLYLVELFETGDIKEITTEINTTEINTTKDKMQKKNSDIMISTEIDTSKIESQPKILNGEVRPSDLRGGSIFDLRYVHGIGKVNATKLVDEGVT